MGWSAWGCAPQGTWAEALAGGPALAGGGRPPSCVKAGAALVVEGALS